MLALVRCPTTLPLLNFLLHKRHSATTGYSWITKSFQMEAFLLTPMLPSSRGWAYCLGLCKTLRCHWGTRWKGNTESLELYHVRINYACWWTARSQFSLKRPGTCLLFLKSHCFIKLISYNGWLPNARQWIIFINAKNHELVPRLCVKFQRITGPYFLSAVLSHGSYNMILPPFPTMNKSHVIFSVP